MTAAWLFVFALLGTQSAEKERAVLRGAVTAEDGAPLSPVTVILMTPRNIERRAVTGPSGDFVFGGLVPGPYRLKVEEPGFENYLSNELLLAASDDRELGVTLSRRPAPQEPPESTGGERQPDYAPMPDRWRIQLPVWERYAPDLDDGDSPYVQGRPIDPYNQNVLKGDYPVIGQDIFFIINALLETPVDFRTLPTPTGISTQRPESAPFFGEDQQLFAFSSAIVSADLFRGDTAFKPRDWAIRATTVYNVNYLATRERNVVDINPEQGATRLRQDLALQEAFGEVKLFDVGERYDFVSVRAGIQPFTSDFRGFLFRDTNLGVRLFGNWSRNRYQWNVALFDQLEKETNSGLNLLERRDQRVFIANGYLQDFLTPGYTLSLSFHRNRDAGEELFYDKNGFLVRPAPVGLIVPHVVTANYIGVGGDGHLGRVNITHQYYFVFGDDDGNPIAKRAVDIRAQFLAVEASFDKDWWRLKGTFLWGSGDADPFDETARGFDSIFDNPNIGGGPLSFWNRETIRLTQTFVGLVGRNSVLASLRSSQIEGQANFVNPGLFLFNVGWDGEITPKLKLSWNVNLLRFQTTEVLETLLFQSRIDNALGIDINAGFQYRPLLNDNVVIAAGAAIFAPGSGFNDIYPSDNLVAPFVIVTLKY